MYVLRRLSDELSIYKNLRNAEFIKKSSHRYSVVVGVGGNMGDVKRRMQKLYIFLNRDKRVAVEKISSILKNPPFGYVYQEFFYNSVMVVRTNMQPLKFLDYLLRVEKRFLRKRSFKDAPRTLDLDIIFFEDRKVAHQRLTIPHSGYASRDSVMIPLCEIKR
ncbi:MAG: 2-amino-4-hydroxy-6-hydroxymethyldihydropteridine diphosphokinase [Sulfuricurvum sp.]|jgi:2-amino-4-hydroxy-6-hydroxymethyldihydropteridine diphosphokinase